MILIGDKNTKRTDFFLKAANAQNEEIKLITYSDINIASLKLEGEVVKIDPPSSSVVQLVEGEKNLFEYKDILEKLQKYENEQCLFLNDPKNIALVLDKYKCKKLLMENGISVSPMFLEEVNNVEELHRLMDKYKWSQVFIKPKYYSGAAGVMAYRCNKDKSRQQLFTSARIHEDEFINTKKLIKYEKKEEINGLLNKIFEIECVVEKWLPKATVNGKSYDLRVVWQFGRREFMVARTASGPITNLHLNNGAYEWEKLNLTDENLNELDQLCESAMRLFPGLNMAGIDVAFGKGNSKPYIIEINGQGDLMYQDIYNENIIYTNQIKEIKKWQNK